MKRTNDLGYAMAALLVGMSIMAVALSVALPIWSTAAKREREAELIFRGQQYARAVSLFQRKYANAFPPNLDILLNERFLRKKYKDPMTEDGEFQLLYAGNQPASGPAGQVGQSGGRQTGPVAPAAQPPAAAGPQGTGALGAARGGITGVASKSTEPSLRLYNGRGRYNEWAFVAVEATTRAGAPTGAPTPGGPGAGQQGGRGQQPGQPSQTPGGVGFPGRKA
jgi:type II secretory pathway pseudopilin PulG